MIDPHTELTLRHQRSLRRKELGLIPQALLLLGLALYPRHAEADPVRPKTPRVVQGESLGSLGLAKSTFRIDERNDRLGVLQTPTSTLFTDELRAAGYRVVTSNSSEDSDSGADEREADPVELSDYLLEATLSEFGCSPVKKTTCAVTMDWRLTHRETQTLVYRVNTRHEETRVDELGSRETARRLLVGTLRSLLSRERFQKALREVPVPQNTAYARRAVQRCPRESLEMPQDSEDALEATALIKTKRSIGSAVIISPDGYLLTAAHVATQNQLTVRLQSGDEFPAERVRVDPERDVALLRLKRAPKKLHCLSLRESSARAGEDVYAIGSPGGEELSFSISRGIVSGRRTFQGVGYIQTDASINPGNSGGPLLGRDGQVIAIISWKLSGKGVEGLAFGVPSPTALAALGLEFAESSEDISVEIQEPSAKHKTKVVDQPDLPWHYVGRSNYKPTPGWVYPVRSFGYTFAILGASTIGTTALLKGAFPTQSAYNTNRDINTFGWILGGTGVGMVLASYILPPLVLSDEPDEPRVEAKIGPAQLELQVTY